MNVIDILRTTALKYPDKPVVIDDEGILTYSELSRDVILLGEQLKKEGVKAGTHVGLRIPDSRDFIIYLFAASYCGATVIPLGYSLNEEDLKELISDLAIDRLIDDTGEVRDLHPANAHLKQNFKNAAFIRPTSGTTGRAKGVVFSHETILRRIDNALQGLDINSNDRILWVLPMAYHFIVSIILYVRAGACVILSADRTPERLISVANKHKANVLYAGPMDFTELTNASTLESLPLLKWCICTVGGISKVVAEKFQLRQSNILRQVYGMIEVGLAIGNISTPPAPLDSVGTVMKGFQVRIVDGNGSEVETGQVGYLQVKGEGLFDGYFNPYVRREQISNDGWFQTGDLVSSDSNGNIYVAGREKSLIEIEGRRIFSEEVENILNDHPSVRISRVYSEKVLGKPKGLTAEIEFIKDHNASEEELRKFCSDRLAEYKVPVRFVELENIPLTATGKVLRHESN